MDIETQLVFGMSLQLLRIQTTPIFNILSESTFHFKTL